MLLREEQLGSLKGVKVTRRIEVEVMADCVEKYCRWSGQTVNLAKSGIFTSKNVSGASLQSLSRNWGCRTINLDSKYLGNTKRRSEDFNFLKDKLQAKLNGWSKKCTPCLLLKSLTKSVRSLMLK